MMSPSIYSYVKGEENDYESDQVQLGDNWHWNMRDHIQLIFHLKNSIFYTGENNWMRSFKNIMEPILNLSYWSEDIEVKDVVFYIENPMGRVLSFLVKKYHDEVYVKEHDLDSLFDEITESDVDFGGALVQKTNTARPEMLPMQSIAFCDQTDILGGPMATKMYFSPDKLRTMSKYGWGDEANGATISLDDLAVLADDQKDPQGTQETNKNRVPGKVVEVYIVRGNLPEHYLLDNDNMEDHYNQLHIIGFYTNKDGRQEGVTLYRKEEDEGNVKFHTSKEVYGRGLGRGVAEGLLHPQVWTNFLTIHKTKMLEAGSKIPLYTDDPEYTQRNVIQDMENLEITTVGEGRSIRQVPTAAPANIQLYAQDIDAWFEQAQLTGAAFDPILGKEAPSGTTFRGQERTVAQGRGLHDRRRGQRAKFIEELYRDWIIPDMVKEITKGKQFLATLNTEELSWVSDQLAENYAARQAFEAIVNLKIPLSKEIYVAEFKQKFSKGGNKRLIEIMKDEFKGVEIKMGINVANKQKDLVNLSDKLLSVFQFVFSNPQGFQQAMQIPALAKSFQDILEFSGLDQADFLTLTTPPTPTQGEEVAAEVKPQELTLNREVVVEQE
jgi:hypothetical protein